MELSKQVTPCYSKKNHYKRKRSSNMETARFAKQTLVFQKTLFENTFNAMAMIQDQTEIIVSSYLDQLPWISEDAKKSLQNSVDLAKKSRTEFKKAVEDGYRKFEELLEEREERQGRQKEEMKG